MIGPRAFRKIVAASRPRLILSVMSVFWLCLRHRDGSDLSEAQHRHWMSRQATFFTHALKAWQELAQCWEKILWDAEHRAEKAE